MLVSRTAAGVVPKVWKQPFQLVPVWMEKRTYKQNTCYIPVCDMLLEVPKVDSVEKCMIGRYLEDHFFPYEPLFVSNGLKKSNAVTQHFKETSTEGFTIYAVVQEAQGKMILGMIIGHITTPYTFKDMSEYANKIKDEMSNRYLNFMAQMEDKVELYKRNALSSYLNISALVVAKEFRRRGIAEVLLKGMTEHSLKKGIKLIRMNTANKYAVKAARNANFEMVYTGLPKAYRRDDGTPWLPADLCIPQKDFTVLNLDLRKPDILGKGEKKVDKCKVSVKFVVPKEEEKCCLVETNKDKNNKKDCDF